MVLYYVFVLFVFGIVLGSFYNVVAYRLPKNESLITPSSHCTKCNHKLGPSELVPVFSYLFQRGKCKKCGDKISCFYMIFELLTGILFSVSYLVFGFSIDLYIALVFVSMSIIIIISDYQTMIIPDEVLIVSSILLLIGLFIKGDFDLLISSLISGLIAFVFMFLLKKIGDFLFKKESMGGGDIKLMFIFGLVLGYKMALISIFIASFIALPISLLILFIKKDNVIPFGPFLSISAVIILLAKIDFNTIINLLIK